MVVNSANPVKDLTREQIRDQPGEIERGAFAATVLCHLGWLLSEHHSLADRRRVHAPDVVDRTTRPGRAPVKTPSRATISPLTTVAT